MTYRSEFPDFPAADMPVIPAGFKDVSWHNDICPRFVSDALGLEIWVDYADPAHREFPRLHRFSVCHDGGDNDLVTNDWQAVLAFVEEKRAQL